jgi:hypothetical protein
VKHAWLFALVSGCTCVTEQLVGLPCDSSGDCLEGFKCVGNRCVVDAGDCAKDNEGIATACAPSACAGQPCHLSNGLRGVCCDGMCEDPQYEPNCGGCGNTCSGGLGCANWSTAHGITPPVISGACVCQPGGTKCPGTLTCASLLYLSAPDGCLCKTAADCPVGQDCHVPQPGNGYGVCWYPP